MRLTKRFPSAVDQSTGELAFYQQTMKVLDAAGVPYLVGGAWTIRHYCGIKRDTKDLDLFLRGTDIQPALAVLAESGFRAEATYPHWLAKAYSGDWFVDLIFNSGNGATPVDDGWFMAAEPSTLFGVDVQVCPVEETIWSKAFVMERERYDGADVIHLLYSRASKLDWPRLVQRFGPHWRVLYAHLVMFGFVYPGEQRNIPPWVMADLSKRLEYEDAAMKADDAAALASSGVSEREVCRGTLLSRQQYLLDLERGRKDARLAPEGTMSREEVERWTAAIPERP